MARKQQGREEALRLGGPFWPVAGEGGAGGVVGMGGGGRVGEGSVTARWGHTCECHITAAGVASADGAKFQFNTSNYRSLMGETTVTVARRRTGGGREEDGEPR